MHPRMVDLVSKKWERFARRIFFRRFLITLCYLFIFLITTILDQTRTEIVEGEGDDAVITNIEDPGRVVEIMCTIGHVIVLAGAVWKGKSEFNEMSSLGLRKYCQTTVK
jgi:hypothetical protein